MLYPLSYVGMLFACSLYPKPAPVVNRKPFSLPAGDKPNIFVLNSILFLLFSRLSCMM